MEGGYSVGDEPSISRGCSIRESGEYPWEQGASLPP